MAAMENEDPEQVRAALVLVSLRERKLRRYPEWVPMQPSAGAEASSSRPGTTVAARAPLRRQQERVRVDSMQSAEAPFLGNWPKAKRSGARGQTSKELPEQGHAAAAAAAAAKGSGAGSCEAERCAATPAAAASVQRQPVMTAVCYTAVVAGSGTGPSTSAAAPAKEAMKTPSPDTPLDYGAGGSGAPSSADDAARPQAKRKGTEARGSVGGGGGDEGCSSSPAKRGPAAVEDMEKPMPISVEPAGVQSETRASSGKGAPRPFDLNLAPCPLDEDDDGCPDTN